MTPKNPPPETPAPESDLAAVDHLLGGQHWLGSSVLEDPFAEDTVDDTTQGLLLLKQRPFEDGALNLLGTSIRRRFEALGAEQFEVLERLLDK